MALAAPTSPIAAPRSGAQNGRGVVVPIRSTLQAVALLGNHLPRQCGIATFTTDLAAAIVDPVGIGHGAGGDRGHRAQVAVNENQGAESTISFLQALRDMRTENR